jgi:formylglycine-generating enzyme required for sulfatase activity
MKKAIKALFVLLFIILTISGAMAAENKNKPEIKTVDNYVAVFDFEVRTKDKDISRSLADSVIHELSQSGKYEIIDRSNMNKILKEQKFQMSGCVAQECKVEAGQILGVGKIVNGSVGIVGKTYYLTLQLIDVQTGKIEISVVDKCKCELDELIDSTTRLAKKLLGDQVLRTVNGEEKERKVDIGIDGGTEYVSKVTGAKFVLIPAGTFTMGSPLDEPERDIDESPQHQVTISRSFYMQTTEVTQGQWKSVMRNNPSYFKNCGDTCPVEDVSWNDCQEYISKLNIMEGTGNYRLPTEAEWEYAARAGLQVARNGDLDRISWYNGNSGNRTHTVGTKSPNAWGLYDMLGNVWEWVQDWKGNYPSSHVTDPTGPPSGSMRVNRGCSWDSNDMYCRSAYRISDTPNVRSKVLGFRIVRIK